MLGVLGRFDSNLEKRCWRCLVFQSRFLPHSIYLHNQESLEAKSNLTVTNAQSSQALESSLIGQLCTYFLNGSWAHEVREFTAKLS